MLVAAVGATVGLAGGGAVPVARGAAAATDDELAFANLGIAAEFLLEDFYGRALGAKLFGAAVGRELERGRFNAREHAASLGQLLAGAGQAAPVRDDFAFVWPHGAFAGRRPAASAGATIAAALWGAYAGAAAAITVPSYRALFASMAGNVAQQVGALSFASGGRVVGISFPPALTVEEASDAIEAFLG